MLQHMDGEDLQDAIDFYLAEPWGCEIEDKRTLFLAHAAHTAFGGEGPDAGDYFQHWKCEPERQQTPEEVAEYMDIMAIYADPAAYLKADNLHARTCAQSENGRKNG